MTRRAANQAAAMRNRYTVPPGPPTRAIAPDCRHYQGVRPCIHNRLCTGCLHYEPYTERICIIKLAALGDVIRTLCLLPELRRRYRAGHITWVSLPNGCRMIAEHPMIDRVLPFDPAAMMVLQQEMFDMVINLDKEPQPCALAMSLFARKKLGIGLSAHGTPVPINDEAHPYFHLGLSDELKFNKNTSSYPQLVYEALGFKYNGQRYELPVKESARDRIRLRLASRGWRPGDPTVGINVGAGTAFANKMWPPDRTVELIRLLQTSAPGIQIMLLGGPGERPIIDRIIRDLADADSLNGVIDSGTEHDEPAFVAVVDACDVVFSGDTMAMHVAIALGKGVVAFFGPTCGQEIDLFGRGEQLVAAVPCAPCYKRVCDHDNACVESISAQAAADAVLRVLLQVWRGQLTFRITPLQKAG
ncbi:MAG: glycosyltransferase family 9 protein [Phycisphaeraceae bacterium]